MTSLEINASVVDRAKAKVEATEAKGLSYVAQIIEAHKQVVAAERSGHQRSLDAAIAAGELLNAAKEAIKGQFKWSEWRSEYLRDIPQTTASLYMRLAKNQDRLRKPDLSSDDGKRISNGLLKLGAAGELSIKKAAALLAEKKPRGPQPQRKKTDEDVGKEWLRVLDVDELVFVLRELFDAEYIGKLARALIPTQPTSTPVTQPIGSHTTTQPSVGLRRA
jgi:hypothetical protein